MQEKMKVRHKKGFSPPRTGRRGEAIPERQISPLQRFLSLFDPTVTMRTIINEGAVFGAFAFWVLFSADQSFPLAATLVYSVYQFQNKRIKRNPEGPFFGGNPMVGAVFSTLVALALGCAVMTVLTVPLTSLLSKSAQSVQAFIVITVMGVTGIYLK